MTVLKNPARERLAKGEFAVGVGLRQARTVDIAPAMASAGMDWLFIDLEHGLMSLDMATQISVTASNCGITPIVRVPHGQYDMATRALDGGAMGIVMPHVDTAEEAQELAKRLRYPPVGHRSAAGAMPQLNFRAASVGEATKAVNDAILVVAMLETPKAFANADAIAAVPGIDILLIGTNDLCMELGIPGEVMHADVGKLYAQAAAACQKHGKWLGMGGIYTEDGIAHYAKTGARFILGGSDLGFVMAGANSRVAAIRRLKV